MPGVGGGGGEGNAKLIGTEAIFPILTKFNQISPLRNLKGGNIFLSFFVETIE